MDEGTLAWGDPRHAVEQLVGGEVALHKRHRRGWLGCGGHRHEPARRNNDRLSVAPDNGEGVHDAEEVVAWREGRWWPARIQPATEPDIAEGHARREDMDASFAGSRLGDGDLLELQNLGAAELADDDCALHRLLLLRRRLRGDIHRPLPAHAGDQRKEPLEQAVLSHERLVCALRFSPSEDTRLAGALRAERRAAGVRRADTHPRGQTKPLEFAGFAVGEQVERTALLDKPDRRANGLAALAEGGQIQVLAAPQCEERRDVQATASSLATPRKGARWAG